MNAKNKKITFTAGVICFASATAGLGGGAHFGERGGTRGGG